MKQTEKWAKQNSSDVIWWKQEPIEERGVIFSFDQVKEHAAGLPGQTDIHAKRNL